jgi:hypothetical protein
MLAAVSAAVPNTTVTTFDNLKRQAVKSFETRVSDKPFVVRWVPSKTPTYQAYPPLTDVSPVAGVDVTPTLSPFFQPPGNPGVQSGQNVLIVAVEGDVVATPSTVGNPYTIDITWLWEVIPDDYDGVAYDCQPSTMSSMLLDKCINGFSAMTVSPSPGNGTAA